MFIYEAYETNLKLYPIEKSIGHRLRMNDQQVGYAWNQTFRSLIITKRCADVKQGDLYKTILVKHYIVSWYL